MNDSKNKLRILFVTSDKYPPFRPAARVIFAEELANRGHVIDWIFQAEKNSRSSSQIPYGNGTAYIAATHDGLSRWNRLYKHALGLFSDLKIFRLVRKNEYDIIQVKDKYIAALFAILAAKRSKSCFVYWLAYPHAEASLYEAKEGIARYRYFYMVRGLFFKFLLYKIILPASDHIFVQSEQMKKDIADEGIPLNKMTPIPGSLSLDEIPYPPPADGPLRHRARGEKSIVYLGTLMRARRLDFLVRVHANVVKTHPTARLYLVGKGEMPEDEQFLKSEADKLGISDSIVFTGHLPLKDAWQYVRDADVCLSPYYPTPILNSTSPTKLIEYMAMEKVVVGNDHPEQSLVIAESDSGLCVPWQEEAFSDAISRLLDNPVIAKKMGERGRTYVKQHRTNRIMATKIEAMYFSLLNEGAASSKK